MTLRDIEDELASYGINSPKNEALTIACHISGLSPAHVYADPHRDYGCDALDVILQKRKERYPLQYIIGTWEFCGFDFRVTPDTLIPRADTEVIVEKAVSLLPPSGRILDLCTGTGCILAAVLKLSGNTDGVAVELYPETADVARLNFENLGLNVKLIIGDATKDLFDSDTKFDIITSNPPYVTKEEMTGLEPELGFEPEAALTDGGDGLSIIEKIIEVYKNHLAENGAMIIEHGYSQSPSVISIAEKNGMKAEIIKDYGGNCRGVVLRKH